MGQLETRIKNVNDTEEASQVPNCQKVWIYTYIFFLQRWFGICRCQRCPASGVSIQRGRHLPDLFLSFSATTTAATIQGWLAKLRHFTKTTFSPPKWNRIIVSNFLFESHYFRASFSLFHSKISWRWGIELQGILSKPHAHSFSNQWWISASS